MNHLADLANRLEVERAMIDRLMREASEHVKESDGKNQRGAMREALRALETQHTDQSNAEIEAKAKLEKERAYIVPEKANAAHGDPFEPWRHPTGGRPKRVAIVGMGPSQGGFFREYNAHDYDAPWDEVWTLNTAIRYVPAHLAFIMDDMREFGRRFQQYRLDMIHARAPIFTSAAYGEFPTAIPYPLARVIQTLGKDGPFHDVSLLYALAYACFLGIEAVYLFGCDFAYPNLDLRERGQALATHWLGFLQGRGTSYFISEESTLLDAHRINDAAFLPFYGYLRQPIRGLDYWREEGRQQAPEIPEGGRAGGGAAGMSTAP